MESKSAGKGIVGIAGAVIAIVAFGFAFVVMTTNLDMTVELTATGIHVQHKGAILLQGTDREIAFSDIIDYRLLNELPKIRKVNGLDNSKMRVGAFTSTEFGDFTAYVDNLKGKAILLETASEKIMLTPANYDAFVAALQQSVGK